MFVHTGATHLHLELPYPGCRTASGLCAVGQGAGGACIAMSDDIL